MGRVTSFLIAGGFPLGVIALAISAARVHAYPAVAPPPSPSPRPHIELIEVLICAPTSTPWSVREAHYDCRLTVRPRVNQTGTCDAMVGGRCHFDPELLYVSWTTGPR